MADLESLIGSIMRMAENAEQRRQDQHKALGINSYWGGTTSNASRAYDDAKWENKLKRIDEQNKQKDLMSTNRDNRDQALALAGMQYGPGGSADRTAKYGYDRAVDAQGLKNESAAELAAYRVANNLGMGGSRSGGGKKSDQDLAMEKMKALGGDFTPEKVQQALLAYEKFNTAPPSVVDPLHYDGAPVPERRKIGDQGQALPTTGQQVAAPVAAPGQVAPVQNQLQGQVNTPFGAAPAGLSPSQWQGYADSRSAANPGRAMQYQGNQPGMVGDQIARFKRADGSTFFANTGAAQMQAGSAGIQPGPNLEGMRDVRSGLGAPVPPVVQPAAAAPVQKPALQLAGNVAPVQQVPVLNAAAGNLYNWLQGRPDNPQNFSDIGAGYNMPMQLAGIAPQNIARPTMPLLPQTRIGMGSSEASLRSRTKAERDRKRNQSDTIYR